MRSFTLIGAASLIALIWYHGSSVVERPVNTPSDTFAILVTGDGGWRAIDRDVAQELNKADVPVAGLIAPEFFGQRKTANEAAQELNRLIEEYAQRWSRQRVILVGYSRGAGVLPFMTSRLSPDNRARISVVALLGLDRAIDFKSSPKAVLWKAEDDLTIPVAPELRKLHGTPVLCVAGANDEDSICRTLSPDVATAVIVPGGHHFGGNYVAIARAIVASAHVRRTKQIAFRSANLHP